MKVLFRVAWKCHNQTEAECHLFGVLHEFLNNRKQGVILDRQVFSRVDIRVGFPLSFILGLFLFLMYINYLLEGFSWNLKLYADVVFLNPWQPALYNSVK